MTLDDSGKVIGNLVEKNWLPPILIDVDDRSWGEMGDDWIFRMRGNSPHEGEDWIKGGGIKLQGEIGINAYSIAFDLGTYSSYENSAGFYSKFAVNEKNFDLSGGTSNGWGAAGSAILSIIPKADVGVYIYGNTQKPLDLSTKPQTSNSAMGNYGLLRAGGDSEGNILFGIGGELLCLQVFCHLI